MYANAMIYSICYDINQFVVFRTGSRLIDKHNSDILLDDKTVRDVRAMPMIMVVSSLSLGDEMNSNKKYKAE